MFGSPAHYRRRSDRKQHSCAQMMQALCQGRSDSEREAIGTTMDPRMPVIDQQVWKETARGPDRAFLNRGTLALAAVRFGDAAFFRGLCSRKELFEDAPITEERDVNVEHKESSIAEACRFEALARGRFDLLQIIEDAAKGFEASLSEESKEKCRAWGADRLSQRYLNPWPQEVKSGVIALALSSSCTQAQVVEGMRWLARREAALGDSRWAEPAKSIPDMILDTATADGNLTPARAALEAGATPTLSNARNAVLRGNLELGSELAKICVGLRSKKPGSWSNRGEEDEKNSSICQAMGEAHLSCLDALANGALSWRAPHDGGREVTWAEFHDGRATIEKAQIMALKGEFDTLLDDLAARAKGRSKIASAARAMALFNEDPAAFRAAIEALEPKAPATHDELLFRARMGDATLADDLASTDSKTLAKLMDSACKRHSQLATWVESRKARTGDDSQRVLAEEFDKVDGVLFTIWNGSDKALPDDRSLIDGHISKLGLLMEYERRALESASAEPARKRGPLKA